MVRHHNKKARRRKPVIYHTPGRECAHANKGCCPRCMAGPKVSQRLTYRPFDRPLIHKLAGHTYDPDTHQWIEQPIAS